MQLPVRPGDRALDLVEQLLVLRVHVVEGHEDAVTLRLRLHDRAHGAFVPERVLAREGQPPTFDPARTDEGRMRTVGPHPSGIEVRAVCGVVAHAKTIVPPGVGENATDRNRHREPTNLRRG
jgi:hypothetical protein